MLPLTLLRPQDNLPWPSPKTIFASGLRVSLRHYATLPNRPVVFIKFGGPEKQAEGDMQRLAFDWLHRTSENPSCNIKVLEVFKIFSKGGVTFIIMHLLAAAQVEEFARYMTL